MGNNPGRQPTDVPLPPLARYPDLPHDELDPEHERRERALARQRGKVRERAIWRKAIEAFRDERPPFIEPSQVTVTFRLGSTGVHALVVWSAGGLAESRVLRRIGGPLPLNHSALRRIGPTVSLLRLLRALENELDR